MGPLYGPVARQVSASFGAPPYRVCAVRGMAIPRFLCGQWRVIGRAGRYPPGPQPLRLEVDSRRGVAWE